MCDMSDNTCRGLCKRISRKRANGRLRSRRATRRPSRTPRHQLGSTCDSAFRYASVQFALLASVFQITNNQLLGSTKIHSQPAQASDKRLAVRQPSGSQLARPIVDTAARGGPRGVMARSLLGRPRERTRMTSQTDGRMRLRALGRTICCVIDGGRRVTTDAAAWPEPGHRGRGVAISGSIRRHGQPIQPRRTDLELGCEP
jgi:hypothetical protein